MHLKLNLCRNIFWPILQSHHNSCQQTNSLPAVGVRDHVTIADGQEGDRDQPHCPVERTGHLLGVVVPVQGWQSTRLVLSKINVWSECLKFSWYLSQTRTVHAAMIQQDTLKTSRTVPGQMVISVFITKRVSKLILLSAPMLREEASVKSLLRSSTTRPIR